MTPNEHAWAIFDKIPVELRTIPNSERLRMVLIVAAIHEHEEETRSDERKRIRMARMVTEKE